MAGSPAAKVLLGTLALTVIFAAVIPAVTRTKLNPGGDLCYLNQLQGSVCDFAYVTSGFSFLFSALLAAGALAAHRGGKDAFLAPIFASLSLFAAFWWMVAAITFTIRGGQADDDGLPQGSARDAVSGLSWLQAVLFFFGFLVVVYNRIQHRAFRTRLDQTRSVLDLEQHSQFKQQYAATQVLGSVPLQ